MSIMENLGRSIAAIDPNTLHGMVPSDNDTTKVSSHSARQVSLS